jgi:DNA mismatch repair protein MutS2
MIIFGNLRTFVKLSELQKTSNNQQNTQKIKVNIEMEKVKDNNFLFGIDLRGVRGDEALIKVTKYIDNAVISGATNLKILHGTGNGILRNIIREYLQKQDYIEWYGDADIRQGGQGVTLVKLKN